MATPSSLTQLRIVHLTLVASSVVVTAIVWGLRLAPNAAPPASTATSAILYVGAAVSLLALGLGTLAWRGIAPYQPPADLAAWLRGASGRMVVTWGLCEGAAVVGGITFFMTGNAPVCAALSILGVIGAAIHAPGKLAAT
jgi:hypothetical protein